MTAGLTPRLRVLLLVMLAGHGLALGAGLLAPYDPVTQHRDLALAPPSLSSVPDAEGRGHVFLLGTDQFGRDQLSRLLHGARMSLFTGLTATALTLLIGLAMGTIAGYFSRLDGPLMRVADLATAVPWIYLLLAARSVFPLDLAPATTLVMVVTIIALLGWARPARLVRSIVLSVKSREFVLAARSLGASHVYVLRRHVIPQTASVMFTQAALLVPQFILAETTLSFLGLGVGEPTPSWGTMLSAAQQYHVLVSSWWMLAPGFGLIVICLLYQALADAVQEHAERVA